ncbi:hypothetical protein LIER_26007 [Lithospermum erythrorhizon]|uniref:Uncharacterized protein n=1 Tax=Lithospermum erythrorhizon TaxID=34254 RepID=A0AAV3RB36_LITER
MEQPLLSDQIGENGSSNRWSSYEYVGRSGSVIPTASLTGGERVSVDEIRAAAASAPPSEQIYPPSLHAPLLGPPPQYPPPPSPQAQGIPYEGTYYGDQSANANHEPRQVLDEVEIRELLIDHVGHRCCWGSRPARTWKIYAIEDCNVYVGTLETFIEERELVIEKEPYLEGNIDGKDKGPELGIWELDLRSEFPVLFLPYKESRIRVPESEVVAKCEVCEGRGNVVCPTCKAENLMSECSSCYGRGLIAHRDGSDSIVVAALIRCGYMDLIFVFDLGRLCDGLVDVDFSLPRYGHDSRIWIWSE